jgi:hypothetical protein
MLSLCLFESGYKLFVEWFTATTLMSLMTSHQLSINYYLETEEAVNWGRCTDVPPVPTK